MSARPLACALALFAGLAGPPDAAGYGGADSFDFLFMDGGAKPAALGGAFVAGRNDADILAYNPAGLASMERHHASFMHTGHFQSVRRDRLAGALRGGLGLSFDRLSFGEIGRTTLSNPSGIGTHGFTPTATVITAGAGLPVIAGWTAGAALKYLRHDIDGHNAAAWAGDAGVQGAVLTNPGLVLGLAVQNFGSKGRFQDWSEPLPLNLRAGGALSLDVLGVPLGISLDVNKASERETILNFGFAATFFERFALRFGQNMRNDAGPGFAFGFGVTVKDYVFDYALVPYGELGSSHQISLGMRWGE